MSRACSPCRGVRNLVLVCAFVSSVFAPRRVSAQSPSEAIPESSGAAGALSVDGTWQELAPPARLDLAVRDPVRDRMIVIAWSGAASAVDVWTLDLAGAHDWKRLTTGSIKPSDHEGATATYDPVLDRVLVLGGHDSSELWALSLGGTPAWTRIAVSGTPPHGRRDHVACYDSARNRLVIHGGRYLQTTTEVRLDDTWALSLSDPPTWTPIVPATPARPVGLGPGAFYDPIDDRMIVCGDGYSAIWSLPLNPSAPSWSAIGDAPPTDAKALTVYDGADHLLAVSRDQLLAFGLRGTPRWTMSEIGASFPLLPEFVQAIHDPARDRVILAGTRVSGAVTAVGPPTWTSFTPTVNVHPMQFHATTFDPARNRMIVVGGGAITRALELSGPPVWTDLASQTELSDVIGQVAIYDPIRDRVVSFSGERSRVPSNETWTLSLTGTREWKPLVTRGPAPPARSYASAIYDPIRDRMIVFGGRGGTVDLNDVWALSLAGEPAWSRVDVSGTPPLQNEKHAAVYDPVWDRMIAWGGVNSTFIAALDFRFTPAFWNALSQNGLAPGFPIAPSLAYDPNRSRLVVFGGGSGQLTSSDRTYALALTGTSGTWSPLFPDAAGPHGRMGSSAIYDPDHDRMVFFSGSDSLTDAWALSFGEPRLPSIATASSRIEWRPGEAPEFRATVTNPRSFAQPFFWSVSSARDWPGFPVTGRGHAESGQTETIRFTVPVPDSAAGGADSLDLRVVFLDVPQGIHAAFEVIVPSTRVEAAEWTLEGDRVRLAWQAEDERVSEATVHRRIGDAEWQVVATLTSSGSGRFEYEDDGLLGGVHYGYRLGIRRGTAEFLSDEIGIDVPPAPVEPPRPVLALAGFQPNPARGDLALAFTLADASPARLEMIDVNGRRVLDRDVGGLGPGPHVFSPGQQVRVRPGLYLLSLTQAGRSIVRRGVVVR